MFVLQKSFTILTFNNVHIQTSIFFIVQLAHSPTNRKVPKEIALQTDFLKSRPCNLCSLPKMIHRVHK